MSRGGVTAAGFLTPAVSDAFMHLNDQIAVCFFKQTWDDCVDQCGETGAQQT
jgi:hypothetical protein